MSHKKDTRLRWVKSKTNCYSNTDQDSHDASKLGYIFLTFLGEALVGVGEEPALCSGDVDGCLAVVPGGRAGES